LDFIVRAFRKKVKCSSLCSLSAAAKAVSSDSVKLGKYIPKAGGCQQNIFPFAGISDRLVVLSRSTARLQPAGTKQWRPLYFLTLKAKEGISCPADLCVPGSATARTAGECQNVLG
jgi:hypothetical protein